MVSKAFLDDLKGRVRLSDVIGVSVKITRAGREFKACCPFHEEKSPSFTINDDKQFYHCFGCGAHGDHFGFLTQYKNLPFMEAVEELAGKAGVTVPKANPKEVEGKRVKDRLITLMDETARYYTRQLHDNAQVDILNYLTERGMAYETIHGFRLGYAPERDDGFLAHLKSKGYSDAEMIEAGLLKKSDRGGQPYPFFRGRIMFPVGDASGRIIAFGARIVPEQIRPYTGRADFTPPKYINTGETSLFHKGSNLYNFSNARQAVGQGARLIVCEGYADVTALVQAGFKGAVAPLGTALTEGQIQLLWSMIPSDYNGTDIKEPILCFDGDGAGRKAARRALERILPLLEVQRSVRFAFLPDGKDPDDLIKQSGAAAFNNVLGQAISLVDMVWHCVMEGQDTSSPDQRAAIEARMMQMIRAIADDRVQNHYRDALKNRLWDAFRPKKQFKPGGRKQKEAVATIPLTRPVNGAKTLRLRVFIATLMRYPHLYERYEEALGIMPCDNQALDHCRQVFISLLSENSALTFEGIKEELLARADPAEIEMILGAKTYMHAPFANADAPPQHITAGLDDLLSRAPRHTMTGR